MRIRPVLDLPRPLDQEARRKWDDFEKALAAAGDTRTLDPEVKRRVLAVFAFSDFFASAAVRRPDLLFSAVTPGEDARFSIDPPDPEHTDSSAINPILRRFRLEQILRIIWHDLTGEADLDETMGRLSALAEVCVNVALGFLSARLTAKHGPALDKKGRPMSLVVLGMGKLGGRELNLSSDIDLVFAFPSAGQTAGGRLSPVSNDHFFTKLGSKLVNTLGNVTADGRVFRVDMRLRPYGEGGPLAMSFDAMENYYQAQGRDWERYAWIKARVVAWDPEAGRELLERLSPFVFRRYLDFGAFSALRDMKEKINREVAAKGMENNIKLGPGGIREVEFFGQIFQMIRGGVTPKLRSRRIMAVLDALVDEGLIPGAVAGELKTAYGFLRHTEHRLQAVADAQTHDLPKDDGDRARLALSMGFETWADFSRELSRHRERVRAHFNALLAPKAEPGAKEEDRPDWEGIWGESMEKQNAFSMLQKAGYHEPEAVMGMLAHFREDTERQHFSARGKSQVDRLVPMILETAAGEKSPETILNRILDLITAIRRRTCYLSLLLENPSVLGHLARLAKASPWIMSFLSSHPVLLDEFLDPRLLHAPPGKDELARELSRRLTPFSDPDLEIVMEEMCVFKQANTLRVAAADITGRLALMKVSDHLTWIAEAVLKEVVDLAWDHLVKRHGMPKLSGAGEKGFAVIAYGKFGGLELGYGSDLDLVFLHAAEPGQTSGGAIPVDTSHFFARLGQRVLHILSVHTPAGRMYETDMRLRPSGSSGLLVSHIKAFEDYQLNSAWTWEHQAIIKARFVAGDADLGRAFSAVREKVLSRRRDKNELKEQVRSMRRRLRASFQHEPGFFHLKQGHGGMLDIEFLVQYFILLKSRTHPELMEWTDNVRQLQTIVQSGIMKEDVAHFLKQAYLIYRAYVHRRNLQEAKPKIPEDRLGDMQQAVSMIWKRFMES